MPPTTLNSEEPAYPSDKHIKLVIKKPRLHISCRLGFFFNQRERARVGSSPMLGISQHRSRKGTPP